MDFNTNPSNSEPSKQSRRIVVYSLMIVAWAVIFSVLWYLLPGTEFTLVVVAIIVVLSIIGEFLMKPKKK